MLFFRYTGFSRIVSLVHCLPLMLAGLCTTLRETCGLSWDSAGPIVWTSTWKVTPCSTFLLITRAHITFEVSRELTEEESSVRGTFVQGLSLADVRALDVFEGDVRILKDEYRRDPLPVFTLTSPASLGTLAIDFTAPSTRQYISPALARQKVEEGAAGYQEVRAWCYCWKDESDRGLSALENRVWE
ncbi:hypothetical protein QFC24_000654 [Naganishia onofrii]|uniref:Uncharacterized protein n=1 Tax=Naganishia onofrii TaxID=1851511 RepID=A0ACC2XXA5_9TREE|nr:hypothetical protein QFC24_000654 [Naganishia onofrii]